MKQLLSALVLGVICLQVNAQKVIEKNLNYNNQIIELDVKFARNIEIKTWNKSTVYFKADIQSEDEKYLDLYQLDIDEKSNRIIIESDAAPLYEAARKDCKKNSKTTSNNNCYNMGDQFKFNYVLYVPKGATFMVSSINGSLKSELIDGDFTADLINGNIEIKSYSGNLDLKTINGVIDLKMRDASMVAETIHGDIYADENLKFKSSKRHVGQKISGTTGSGKNSLQLNTINGNIYLR